MSYPLAPTFAFADRAVVFFAAAFEKSHLDSYDATRAHFRTFLRVCVDRFVANQRAASQTQKRGGGITMRSLDFPGAERDLDVRAAFEQAPVTFAHDRMIVDQQHGELRFSHGAPAEYAH